VKPSDPALYLAHILESIALVQSYVAEIDLAAFSDSQQIQDAVVRRLEIIGEAVKNLPADLRDAAPGVPWRQIAGMRDKVAHDYMGVDMELVWTVVHHDQALRRKSRTSLNGSGPQSPEGCTGGRKLPPPDQTMAAGGISSISAA
jgi:uncharacterized protein with HEPN domain